MKVIIAGLLLFFTLSMAVAQPSNVRWEYIQRYKNIAIDEMKRTGIPASIKLAQGLLESGAGTSVLARKANNHFGMKCGTEWRGPTYYVKDDDYDENGQLIESCFRAYEDSQSSYIAHSEFLRDPNKAYRYGFLFRLDKDYKKWAQGLKSAGYATSPTYADGLISIIDQYKLFNYDKGDTEFDLVRVINDVKITLAKSGQTPEELAKKYNVKTRCLLKFNEGLKGPNQPLEEGEYIYLQRKRWFFRGKQDYHFVKEGESMYKISQQYGLKLSRLYKKNRMDSGTEPATGQKIRLRGKVKKGATPKLRSVEPMDTTPNDFPTDDGSGKVLDIDGTNIVKPSDLPNTNGNPATTPSNNNANGSTPILTTGGKPTNDNKTPNSGTTTTTKPTTTTPPSGTTTKPTTNSGGTTTKPTTTTPSTTPTPKPEVKPTTTPTTKPKPEPIPSATTTVKHTVKAGDTLYSLARQYGVTVDQIKTLNNMTDNNIKLGQELIVKK